MPGEARVDAASRSILLVWWILAGKKGGLSGGGSTTLTGRRVAAALPPTPTFNLLLALLRPCCVLWTCRRMRELQSYEGLFCFNMYIQEEIHPGRYTTRGPRKAHFDFVAAHGRRALAHATSSSCMPYQNRRRWLLSILWHVEMPSD